MTYELRTYTVVPGKLPELLARFRDHTIRLLTRHGMENIGYWTQPEDANVLVYLIRHTGDAEVNWAAFKADPEWITARAASVAGGPLTTDIQSAYLLPAEIHEMSLLGQVRAG